MQLTSPSLFKGLRGYLLASQYPGFRRACATARTSKACPSTE
jgi:hypothetical protein